jgi:hypothetical protein
MSAEDSSPGQDPALSILKEFADQLLENNTTIITRVETSVTELKSEVVGMKESMHDVPCVDLTKHIQRHVDAEDDAVESEKEEEAKKWDVIKVILGGAAAAAAMVLGAWLLNRLGLK